jgi:hypothetical protein
MMVVLPAMGTACSIIAPAPTPLPILPTATAQPSPTATAPALPTSAPIPTATPPSTATAPGPAVQPPEISPLQANRITFPPGGTSVTLQKTLAPNGLDRYVLRGLAGQTMTVNLVHSVENVTLQIFGADGSVFASGAARISNWSARLPTTQDYYIAVISDATVAANYTLAITIPPLAATPMPDNPRRISFAPGATRTSIQGATATPGQDRFVLRALAGQTMSVNISSAQGSAILIIYGADGNVLISDHAGATSWSGRLPTTQDYFIDTRSVGNAVVPFTLTVTIPPLAEAPTPTPKRISFPAGGTTVTVQSTLPVGQIDRWVLRALAGQTMTVNTSATQGQVILIIWGVQDGNVLISDHAGATSWTGQLPTTEDYYIDVRSVGSAPADYALQVTIPPP